MTDTERALSEFLASRKYSEDGHSPTVGVDEPLLEGLLDSIGILQLATFIDERFGIRVQDVDLIPENFSTVRSIAAYVERKAG